MSNISRCSPVRPGADCEGCQLPPLVSQDPGGVGLVPAQLPPQAVTREEVGGHGGVVAVTSVLPRVVGVAEDVVVSSLVLPQRGILKCGPCPGAVTVNLLRNVDS